MKLRYKFNCLMKLKIVLLASLFVVNYLNAKTPTDDGKVIFTARCSGCHNISKTIVGPALAGVDKRRSIYWIINFVHSSQSVIKKGDKEAIALFNQYNQIKMPDHSDLSSDDIKSVVSYIQLESKDAATGKGSISKPYKLKPGYMPLSISNYGFFLTYIGVVAVLILVLLFLVQVKIYERIAKRGNDKH